MNVFRDKWTGHLPITAAEPQREEFTALRPLGIDAISGKPAYALTEPGGVLDHMADVAGMESAATLLAVVSAVLEVEDDLSSEELAVFLRPTVDALREVFGIATKRVSAPAWDNDARKLGDALRATMIMRRER
jgi:hypothetical protein